MTPDLSDPAVLAYVLAQLRADGDHAAADALMEQVKATAKKAMSAYAADSGGAMVPEAASSCGPKKKRRPKGRRLKRVLDNVLKSLDVEGLA